MKFILLAGLISGVCIYSHAQNGEKIVKSYFSGWEKKDWNMVVSQLAEDFTFTSPSGDDHISIEKFKEKCWVQADYIKGFEFVRIVQRESEVFALIHVITKEGKVIRNTEFFTFSDQIPFNDPYFRHHSLLFYLFIIIHPHTYFITSHTFLSLCPSLFFFAFK